MIREVRRTYLELRSPADLRAAPPPPDAVDIRHEPQCSVARYRELYRDVGRAYHWRDREAWSDADLAAYLARADVAVYVLSRGAEPLGYFELQRHADGSVEIVYFGLVRAAHGQGIGKWMLTRAAEAAWAQGATRVWLHTCTLDSPAALPNYQARGFVPYRTETYTVDLPEGTSQATVPDGASD